jgi:chondroitin AC lyase
VSCSYSSDRPLLRLMAIMLLLGGIVAAVNTAAPSPMLPPSPFPAPDADGRVVLSRLLQPLLPSSAAAATAATRKAKAWQAAQLGNGSWADVPYGNRDRGDWLAMAHLSRTKDMAVAVRSPLSPLVNDTAMLAAANSALRFWLTRHYSNPNWYWNEIGTPQALGNIFLLLEGRGLDVADVSLALDAIGRASMSSCDGSCGGANVADMATITVQEGLLTGNETLAQAGLVRLYANVAVFPQAGEGLQTDASFHQVRHLPVSICTHADLRHRRVTTSACHIVHTPDTHIRLSPARAHSTGLSFCQAPTGQFLPEECCRRTC